MQTPTFLYGTAWKEHETARHVDAALHAGFRGIDTANQRKHYHEEGVGEALQRAYEQGLLTRSELFLQTKFTSRDGQDHRLPYDPEATVAQQVEQSFASSLEHLRAAVLDAYVLHGPSTPVGLAPEDRTAWKAMEGLYRAGKTRALGVSNVSFEQLHTLCELAEVKPRFVQNRCFARTGWDQEVRAFCRAEGIVYQGFSLLTANGWIGRDPRFVDIVRRSGKTAPQVVFRFALQVGMLPLTGTTDPGHMREDLACAEFELPEEDVRTMERLAGTR